MAITGAHVLLYSSEPEALRATLRDVFGWTHVDAGDGWLIFALPPAELGIHPTDDDEKHELYLMCDDVEATVKELAVKGVTAGEISDQGWGRVTMLTIADGVRIGLYEPRHPTALHLAGR